MACSPAAAACVAARRRPARHRSSTLPEATARSHASPIDSSSSARAARTAASARATSACTVARSASVRRPPAGTLPPAIATRSSSAPRPIPRQTDEMASASSPNSGNAYSGPVWTGGSVNTDALSSDGTCTPASSMSWLPVARSPMTCHVSWIVNASRRSEHEPHVGHPVGQHPHRAAVVDHAAAHQPVGVPAAARERPAAADAVAARLGGRAALGREDAGDHGRRPGVDRAGALLGQVAGEQPARRADGDAPGRRGVAGGERLDRGGERSGVRLEAAGGLGHAQPEQTGLAERAHQRLGQLPAPLGLRRELRGGRGEAPGRLDRVRRAGREVMRRRVQAGGARTSASLSSIRCSPSLTRFAWNPMNPPSLAAFAASCAADWSQSR